MALEYFVSFWATIKTDEGNIEGEFSFISFRPQQEVRTYDDVVKMNYAIRDHIGAHSLVILYWKQLVPMEEVNEQVTDD